MRVLTNAHESVVGEHGRLSNGVRAEVGELLVLQVAPHLFDGIEVVPIGRQTFGDEPVALVVRNAFIRRLR